MLCSWIEVQDEYLYYILSLETHVGNWTCQQCHNINGHLRCKDCFGSPILCKACCMSVHQQSPFHHIEKWSSGFFTETSLDTEGFVLYLGHSGAPCPVETLIDMDEDLELEAAKSRVIENDDIDMLGEWEITNTDNGSLTITVVDCNGVHHQHVRWCCCPDAPSKDIQLLKERLFPASVHRPSTAFTFQVLDYFHIDAVECKTSAMNFYSKLKRLTNYTFPSLVSVCSWHHN